MSKKLMQEGYTATYAAYTKKYGNESICSHKQIDDIASVIQQDPLIELYGITMDVGLEMMHKCVGGYGNNISY